MAIDKDLFSSHNFQSTIRNYCSQVGWSIFDLNADRAIVKFTMDSGSIQTVFIVRYDNTLEISCPSGLKFNHIDDVPHRLSSHLLNENSKYKLGFWCIEKIGGQQFFSIMHNSQIGLTDVNHFVSTVRHLISKCDEFEQLAEHALSRN